MTYLGQRSWPPVWVWTAGSGYKEPIHGEIGLLIQVAKSSEANKHRIFLRITEEDNHYIGCVLIGEANFAKQIYARLCICCGLTIRRIGDLDVSDLL